MITEAKDAPAAEAEESPATEVEGPPTDVEPEPSAKGTSGELAFERSREVFFNRELSWLAFARRVLALAGLTLADMDVIELNEAFAAQGLAVLRELGLADDDPRVNPNGGAIALGHPLGMSGARLVTTALYQLRRSGGRYALCTMCIGVGQGIALIIERV